MLDKKQHQIPLTV